jgi:hypothetical protein
MMLEGVGWEGQVQVEYLSEQGLDLSKEGRTWKEESKLFVQIFLKDYLSVCNTYFANTLSAFRR